MSRPRICTPPIAAPKIKTETQIDIDNTPPREDSILKFLMTRRPPPAELLAPELMNINTTFFNRQDELIFSMDLPMDEQTGIKSKK